jgi:hypothetical protein
MARGAAAGGDDAKHDYGEQAARSEHRAEMLGLAERSGGAVQHLLLRRRERRRLAIDSGAPPGNQISGAHHDEEKPHAYSDGEGIGDDHESHGFPFSSLR